MALPVKKRYTAQQYLELERQAEYKSEFIDGEIFALAGALEPHNLISTNLTIALGTQLRNRPNPCKFYAGDMRVQVTESRRYTYPDTVIVCDEAKFTDDARSTLTNPMFIIEILSSSTERYDRGEKFRYYRTLSSLQTYVLVSQNMPLLEVFERQANDEWVLKEYTGLDTTALLPKINCELRLSEVYVQIDLDAETKSRTDETNS